jgi:hypothetical protein
VSSTGDPMKTGLFVSALLISFQIFAFSNPLRRICLEKQGQFFVFDLNQNQVAGCQLGHSIVGALDLVRFSQNLNSESLLSYSQRKSMCFGNEFQIQTAEVGNFKTICQYFDGSFIDIQSLHSGRDSGLNPDLNSALGL